jgi:hypothetical protein
VRYYANHRYIVTSDIDWEHSFRVSQILSHEVIRLSVVANVEKAI